MARAISGLLLQAALASSPPWQDRAAETLMGPALLACFESCTKPAGTLPSAAQLSCRDGVTHSARDGSMYRSDQQQRAAAQWAGAASNAAQAITVLVQQRHRSAQQALPAAAMQGLLSCFAALAPSVAAKAEPQWSRGAVQLRMQRAAALQHVAHAAALLLARRMQVLAIDPRHHCRPLRCIYRVLKQAWRPCTGLWATRCLHSVPVRCMQRICGMRESAVSGFCSVLSIASSCLPLAGGLAGIPRGSRCSHRLLLR